MSDQGGQHVVITQQGKSMAVAYVLWFFLGGFGVHRFYLERTGSAIAQLVLTLVGAVTAMFFIGIFILLGVGIWLLVDLALIPGIVNEYNSQRATRTTGFQIGTHRERDNLDQLDRLHELYQKGALSEDEYQARKAKLMTD